MSSMRSASSSTSSSTRLRSTLPRSMWSLRRPGVAMTMSTGLRDLLELPAERHAADQAGGEEALAGAVAVRGFLHLHRQLARRREHEHARAVARGRVAARAQALQARQDEGGGLAAAGLRRDQQVAARQHRGNGFALHRRGLGIAEAREVIQQSRIEAERREAHRISGGADQDRYAGPKGNLSTGLREGGGTKTARADCTRERARLASLIFRSDT